MRLSILVVLLLTLVPGTLLAEQTALVVRGSIAYEKPDASTVIQFRISAGETVKVFKRRGGWKQISKNDSQRLGWIRGYQIRENVQYRSSVVESNQDSRGFLSGLASLSRKVSGFFETPSASTTGAVATIGIRGRAASSSSGEDGSSKYWLSTQRIVDSKGDESQLSLLQSYASNAQAAREFASEDGLKARTLPLLGGR